MDNYLTKIILIGAIVVAGIFGIVKLVERPDVSVNSDGTDKLGQAIYIKDYFIGSATSATTTGEIFLGTGVATNTSLVYNTSAADLISIDINFDASTTNSGVSPTLYWINEFSHNLVDWFPETGRTVDTTTKVTHGAGDLVHQWTYASSTLTIDEAIRKTISVEPIASQLGRTSFWVDGAADVWAHVIVRERR